MSDRSVLRQTKRSSDELFVTSLIVLVKAGFTVVASRQRVLYFHETEEGV